MGWWRGDLELFQYYGELDRRDQERRRELDMQLIESRTAVDSGGHRISAAEQSRRRAKYRADAERQRDWIERQVRTCVYVARESCETWAVRTSRILRTGSDDAAETRLLRDDVRAVADANQRGLRSIASALTGEQSPSYLTPRLHELLKDLSLSQLPAPSRPVSAGAVRAQILLVHLPAETRSDWLQGLRPERRPDPLWTDDIPADAARELAATVTAHARYARTEANDCSAPGAAATYVDGCTA